MQLQCKKTKQNKPGSLDMTSVISFVAFRCLKAQMELDNDDHGSPWWKCCHWFFLGLVDVQRLNTDRWLSCACSCPHQKVYDGTVTPEQLTVFSDYYKWSSAQLLKYCGRYKLSKTTFTSTFLSRPQFVKSWCDSHSRSELDMPAETPSMTAPLATPTSLWLDQQQLTRPITMWSSSMYSHTGFPAHF